MAKKNPQVAPGVINHENGGTGSGKPPMPKDLLPSNQTPSGKGGKK